MSKVRNLAKKLGKTPDEVEAALQSAGVALVDEIDFEDVVRIGQALGLSSESFSQLGIGMQLSCLRAILEGAYPNINSGFAGIRTLQGTIVVLVTTSKSELSAVLENGNIIPRVIGSTLNLS